MSECLEHSWSSKWLNFSYGYSQSCTSASSGISEENCLSIMFFLKGRGRGLESRQGILVSEFICRLLFECLCWRPCVDPTGFNSTKGTSHKASFRRGDFQSCKFPFQLPKSHFHPQHWLQVGFPRRNLPHLQSPSAPSTVTLLRFLLYPLNLYYGPSDVILPRKVAHAISFRSLHIFPFSFVHGPCCVATSVL